MSKVIDRTQLLQIQAAYEAGFNKCASTVGLLKPYMSLTEAYGKYGRYTVDRWFKEGLIDIIKDGAANSNCRIDRERIELVASMSNRERWFETHK